MNERSLQVTYVPIDTLRPAERNPRTHSKAQIGQIAASVDTFGFNNPLLVDRENRVVAGHGRLAAAKELGLTELPTLRIEHLSEAQLRAYALADNQIATQAGWDEALLAVELNYIAELDIELDLTATGFSAGEIDVMLAVSDDESAPEPPPPFVNDTDPPVSRAGDLWLLGNHRLYCGDATQPAAYAALLGDDRAQMVFTDPPYNVRIHGHVSGLGAVQHREFEMASGEMSVDEFTQFLQASFEQIAEASCDGSIHFVCMDWRHLHELSGKFHCGLVGALKKIVVVRQLLHLLGYSVDDALLAVAQVATPQARHPVEHAIAVTIVDVDVLSAGNDPPAVLAVVLVIGERVKMVRPVQRFQSLGVVWHVSSLCWCLLVVGSKGPAPVFLALQSQFAVIRAPMVRPRCGPKKCEGITAPLLFWPSHLNSSNRFSTYSSAFQKSPDS